MGKKRNRSESFTKLSTTDSGKRSDDCDSQEEFDTEAGLAKLNNGVRCSARVIEKQEKLRRESSPAKHGSAASVDHAGGSQSSSVVTPTTRPSFMSPSNHANPGDEVLPIADSYWDREPGSPGTDTATYKHLHDPAGAETCNSYSSPIPIANKRAHEEKRKKRNWEVWSQDDKLHFFEALNEFGKDFDAIQNHLASKQKSRSRMALSSASFVPKNKDQVRHFYYRTWHKIAKHLKFPKDMKRANQELYGLVNYGELRKKQRVLNVKNAAKLSELMEKGMTTIKVRGKTFRIKTPVCRAIKRMNLLDDEHSRVPCKIWLELTAKDLKAWSTVQSVAHNPRICAQVPPQRTLSSVITYFEEKWKTQTERLKEQFVHGFGKKRVPLLRFIPVEQDTRIPIFKMSECTNSAMISLRSYTEKVLQKPPKDSDQESMHSRMKSRRKHSGNHSDSHGEPELSDADIADGSKYGSKTRASSDMDEKPEEKFSGQFGMRAAEHPTNMNCNSVTEEKVMVVGLDSKPFDEHVAPAHVARNMCSCSPSTKYHVRDRDSEDIVGHIWDDETVKRGWNAPEAGLITIGELYLMLGKCQRLAFKYCWDDDEQEKEPKLIDKLIEVARALRKRKSMRTKSYNSYNASSTTSCPKCGYQSEQFTPPPAPVFPHRPLEQEHLKQNSPVPVTTQDFCPIEPALPSATSSYITVYAGSTSTFTNPHNVHPNASLATSNEPPPKPFMDLTKGNRRISRINSRRIFLPNFPRPLQQNVNPDSSIANAQAQHHFENIGNDRNAYARVFPTLTEPKEPINSAGTSNQISESCQLPISSSEIASLLKDKSNDKNDPENTFSLSSFMDISLPESTRLVADDVSLNVDRLLDESSIGEKSRNLETPRKSPTNHVDNSETDQREQLQNTSDGTWMPEGNELTFTNLLTTFDMSNNSRRGESNQAEVQDVNFQSVVGEVNFTSNFPPTA